MATYKTTIANLVTTLKSLDFLHRDDLVTSWSVTTSDTHYPSEKLVKDSLDDKISKSNTSGLVRNDGSVDTSTYLTSHQDISGKVNTSDIVDNLSTDNASKVLSAKQGKVLNDLIGDAIEYINQ